MKTLFLFLLLSLAAAAQTTVTGTVVDPNGNPYAGGSASAQNLPASGQALISVTPVAINSAGLFSMTVPSAGNWVFTLCAPPTSLGPTQNPQPSQICFTTQPIAVSGSTQDISASLAPIAAVIGPKLIQASPVLTTAPPANATITNACPLNANGVGTQTAVDWVMVPNLTNTFAIVTCYDTSSGALTTLANSCTLNASTGTCTPPPTVQPTMTCSPSSLLFPNTNTGQTSASQTVACSNTSTSGSSVIFSGITLTTGTNFSIVSQNCGTIAVGASCTIAVNFSPSAVQAYSDTLSIASNAQGSPVTVALSGTGVTPTIPTPSSVTISPGSPSVGIGATSNETATLVMSDSTTHPSIGAFWHSATPGTATVSNVGVVTGVASGTSVISANGGSYVSPNNAEAHAGTGPFTSQVLPAFASPNLSGDRILCAVMWGSATGTVSGVTDTAGNTYAAITGTLEQANSNSVQWWTATGIAAASSNVITVTWSGAGVGFPDPICIEVQGDTAVDQAAVGTIASGTSIATTAITPAQASETIFSAVITGNFVKAVNSGAFCIVAGGSGQNGLNGTSCPVSGAGSAVFQQGTFSTSAVTPTGTLNASATAVISSVALKTVTGTTTATVSNGGSIFSINNMPPAGTNLYPTSPAAISGISSGPLYNTPIPSGATTFPLQHCYGNTSNCTNGDAIAKFTVTGNGSCTFNAADTSTTGCGLIIIPKAQTSTDLGYPIYPSSPATDPYYSVGSACNLNNPGQNFKFQCTNNAQFGGSTTDQALACYDQAQQILFAGYAFNKGVGFSIGGPATCGHAGTLADPCPLPGISACFANRAGTDPTWGSGTYSATVGPNTYTLGFSSGQREAAIAQIVRIQELISGNINHAIGIGVPCNASTLVFPASSVDLVCTGSNGLPVSSSDPIFAGLYWCDYTTAQINAMGLPAWKSALLKACSTYGMYPIYTIGGQAFTGFQMVNSVESQTAYKFAGQTTSPINPLCSQSQIAICTTGSPSTAIFETDIFNADIPLVQTVGSTSSDPAGHACNSVGGCDWRGHIHLLDPCVAKTMAGQPGGC
jgi:hypothetical protein